MLLTERYKDKIEGVLACYDRIVIHGNIPVLCFDGGMTSYLHQNSIKIFDYPDWANTLREELREHAERIAKENGLEIEFIRKINAFRKDDRIQSIIEERGNHPGLVHIFSAMETCTSYKPWHDKQTGKTFVKTDSGKCLHYYFYFIDTDFGLCYASGFLLVFQNGVQVGGKVFCAFAGEFGKHLDPSKTHVDDLICCFGSAVHMPFPPFLDGFLPVELEAVSASFLRNGTECPYIASSPYGAGTVFWKARKSAACMPQSARRPCTGVPCCTGICGQQPGTPFPAPAHTDR